MTTIQISQITKRKIATFGTKEDTYDDILNRMYDMAVQVQLKNFLLSTKNTVTLEEARRLINNG